MKKRMRAMGAAGLLVLSAAVIFFGLTVRQVRCVLNGHEVSTDFGVCRQLQALRGSRLLMRDFQRDPAVGTLLYDQHSQIGYDIATSEKSLGGTVTLYLTDQPPLYRMQIDGQNTLIAKQGGARADNPQLLVPLVTDPNGVYQREPERFHRFLGDFLTALDDRRSQVTEITLESAEKITVRLTGFPLVLLTEAQDPRQAAVRLALLLDRLRPAEIDLAIRELDLRFTLPVLRTVQSSSSATIDSQE